MYQFTYREISLALYLSLCANPFYVAVERCVSKVSAGRKEAMLRYFDYSMLEAEKYGELYLPEGSDYGASVWSKPLTAEHSKRKSSQKVAFILENLGAEGFRKYQEITDFMSAQAGRIVPGNSWYLSIVGVSPGYQGRGLGRALLEPVLDKLDGLGVPVYLETFTPRNKNFYGRLGFQERASFLEPVTGCEYWIMLRDPRGENPQ